MKKILAVLLVLSMAFAFAACGGDTENEGNPVDVLPTSPSPGPTEEGTGLGLAREYAQTMGMVAAGYVHSLGLRTDGTALSAGHDYYGQRQVGAWTDVMYIAAGKSVSIGVKADGTVVLAGKLTDEAALAAASAWTNVFMADAGGDFVAALLNDGTVVAAGDNSASQCDVSGWSDIVQIACGDAFTIGLKSDGTVVATSGAPEAVASWSNVKKIAAGGVSAVAAITAEGKLVSTLDIAGLEAYTDIVDVGADDCGVACVRADGTVVTKLTAETVYDPDYNYGEVDLTTVTDAVAISVGAKHVVVMRKNGSAAAYGVNDDLQCDVGRFNLRPYLEQLVDGGTVVRGLEAGMTVADAKALIAAGTGAADVQFTKLISEAETAVADTDAVATGMKVKCDGAEYGTVVLLGDVDENGTIDAADREIISKASVNNIQLTGYLARASQLETSALGLPFCGEKSLALIDAHLAGTGKIGQFSKMKTGVYDQLLAEAAAANKDTVGWISIPKTNVSYPIMFDASGKWYYNTHTPDKKETDSGSIYAYYYGVPELKNTVVTGHNSRPSGSMFHQLHHIQEFNLGNTNCAQKKYCGVELKDLPNLQIYSNRVWTITIYGEESRWELFSMYETEAGVDIYDSLYDNVWWPWGKNVRVKDTDELIQAWIEKQIEMSEVQIDTSVSVADRYLTVFTCGNEHDDANEGARLYFFFKQVD
ncbi:MAG TPA: hypothetical protein VN540_06565 [Clostridia bacterium]|nr:hypothetical protein [Clostridia bacterium]